MDRKTVSVTHAKLGYLEIANKIISDIESGYLVAGASLPSTRDLAAKLGVSRDTAVHCYKYLQSLSYIESEGPRGSYVRYNLLTKPDQLEILPIEFSRLSALGRLYLEDKVLHPFLADFTKLNYGAIPRDFLPIRHWRELMQSYSKPAYFRNLQYEMEVLGRSELREAISLYLNRTKNFLCSPKQIAIFSISVGAVELLCRLLLQPGDLIAVENPGFGAIKNIAGYHNLEIAPIGLDQEGLIVDQLDTLPRRPKLVYITPNGQDPSGVSLSMRRRIALIEWCKRHRVWIIEDDFDGFFLHNKAKLPSLASLDSADNVIYVSTFWQVLYPLTTTSFVVAPKNLIALLERSKAQTHGIPETMVQLALSEMLTNGFLQKHIQKLEKIIGGRLRAFMYHAKNTLAEYITFESHFGGLNCLTKIHGFSSNVVLEAAEKAKLPLVDIKHCYLGDCEGNEYLVNFAALSEEQSKACMEAFAQRLLTQEAT